MNIINNTEVEDIIIASSGGSISLQCSPHFDEDIIMVGLDDYFRLLRSALLDKYTVESTPIVFSLVGAPGIGKTTLCKKLYTDNKVVSHFDNQAWITIPPRYNGNVQQLLCHLLQSMRPTPLNQEIDILGSTVSQLKDQLHKHLKKCKRYLIVLDDVPNTLLWDDINQCFPHDSNRSPILLTTLFTDVAEYIARDPPNMVKEHLQMLVCTMPTHFRKKEVYYCKFPSIRKLKVVYKDGLVPGCCGGRCCRNCIIILENFEDLLRLESLMVMVPVGSITLLERLQN
nr:putative late blight resistance protein homolog R1B-8 [Ipomoea batatas]